jgi:nucleoside-diphosphate-sugar epimerase
MRVLLIGGTQFIGRRILESLTGRGDEVTIVHRGQTEPGGLPEAEHLHLDRGDLASVAERVKHVDAVVDCYALTRSDAATTLPHLPDVPLVVLSSMDVYRHYELVLANDDRPMTVPIDELSPLREGRYPYGDDYDKLEVEPAYLERGGTVLRLARIYGPHDKQRREEHVLRRVRAGRRIIPAGGGNTLWTSLHVDDVASAVLAVLDQPGVAAGEVFNIGEPQTLTMRGRMRVILDACGHDAALLRVPDEELPVDLRVTRDWPQHLLVSSAKAMAVLGWQPGDQLAAQERSVRWHLENPPADSSPDFSADDRLIAAYGGSE